MSAFPLSRLNVAHYLIKLFFIYLRPLLGMGVKGIADDTLLGLFDTPSNKLVITFCFHKQSGTRIAALTLVEE